MALTLLNFGKVWTDSNDFPTYEGSEEQVRADLQYHPDAIKAFLNETLIPEMEDTMNTLSSSGSRFISYPVLTAAGWGHDEGTGYYTQTVEAKGLTATSPIVHVGVYKPGNDHDSEAAQEKAFARGVAGCRDPQQSDGKLTFFFAQAPEIDITLKVGVV